jgi:hypothetical protein
VEEEVREAEQAREASRLRREDVGVFAGSFAANVSQREARIYTFTKQ